MILRNFFDDIQVQWVLRSAAAGTGDVITAGTTSDFPATSGAPANRGQSAVDLQGFSGVAFVAAIPVIASGGSCVMVLQHTNGDPTAAATTWVDIEDTETPTLSDTDDDNLLGSQVYAWVHNPRRYIRAKITRTTANVTVGAVVAYKFGGIHHAQMPHARIKLASGGRPTNVAGRG